MSNEGLLFNKLISSISRGHLKTSAALLDTSINFDSPAKLAAFAGIDPTVFNSGKFTGTKMVMSKRGSPYLRRALWIGSATARRFDPELAAFYQRKLAEGKHPNTALGAVCHRLLNRAYSIVKEQRPYQPKTGGSIDFS